ncbi:glucosaminidase domain-containing protein [Candidatus Daviesbacteria bacterium]|nr:glucosaminidase domain-containing protein [Candidatus Daviesbacteria bacterium]
MKKKILFFLLLISSFAFLTKQVLALNLVEDNNITQTEGIKAKKLDKRAKILAEYLAKFDSPLQNHAQDFIDASNTYNLDWKLLPAIAGVESTFGKYIPGGYNGWGWGVYGTQAIHFNSWKEAIFTIAKGLRENYLDKGLTDPFSINRIYAASPHWGGKVTYFMQDLEAFANQFEADNQEISQIGQSPNIAAISGQLALR